MGAPAWWGFVRGIVRARHHERARSPGRVRRGCSLARIIETLLATVLGERNSSRPISTFVRPAASLSRICSLPLGELRKRGGGAGWYAVAEERTQPTGERRAEHGLPGRGGMHGGEDVLAVGALEQVADRSRLDRGVNGGVVLEHREHQDRGRRAAPRGSRGWPPGPTAPAAAGPSVRRRARHRSDDFDRATAVGGLPDHARRLRRRPARPRGPGGRGCGRRR